MIRWIFICSMLPLAVAMECANAADMQCVRLNPATVCATSDNCYDTSDCVVDCDGVSVGLIGRCSSTAGVADSTVQDDISVSATSSDNVYCWCAMATPYATRWVFRYKYSVTGYECAKNCARGCRNAMIFDGASDADFRRILYDSVLVE